MAALSAKLMGALKESTHGMAEALLEDLAHFRSVVARRETSRSELRRLCADIRRLLIERELAQVAAPRIGKLELIALDYKPFYEAASRAKFVQFFGRAGTTVFGTKIGPTFVANFGQVPTGGTTEELGRRVSAITEGHDPAKRVAMRLDNFLSQNVLCFKGRWITRGAAIKHIAYVSSGVHSGPPKTEEDEFIGLLRTTCSYNLTPTGVEVRLSSIFNNPKWDMKLDHGMTEEASKIVGDLPAVDPVLVELLIAAQLVVESPSVIRLEEAIRSELSAAAIHRTSFPY